MSKLRYKIYLKSVKLEHKLKHNFLHKHFVAGYILLCLSIILLLLVYYSSIGSSVAEGQNYTPRPVIINNTVYCSFSDKTFCSTEVKFISYVNTNDFSDILQSQTPSPVSCTAKSASKECDGINNGLNIKLFQVMQNGSFAYLTRNQYIVFFNSFTQKYGKFKFSTATYYDPGVKMVFENNNDSASLALLFVKNGQYWNLDFPEVAND